MVSRWLSVCPSISQSIHLSVVCMSSRLYFCFQMITWVNVSGFSPNLVCALRQFACCVKSYFLGKLRNIFENVVYWNFYPACKVLMEFGHIFICKTQDKRSIKINTFLIFHGNICYGNSLEAPQWGASNEYPQHVFMLTNKENIIIFWLKKALCFVQFGSTPFT